MPESQGVVFPGHAALAATGTIPHQSSNTSVFQPINPTNKIYHLPLLVDLPEGFAAKSENLSNYLFDKILLEGYLLYAEN